MPAGERMSAVPVDIAVDNGVTEALRIMRHSQVRRLPVMDDGVRMPRTVSEKGLRQAFVR